MTDNGLVLKNNLAAIRKEKKLSQAELAKIERETKDRIRIAISATAVLLLVAAIAIVVRLITR